MKYNKMLQFFAEDGESKDNTADTTTTTDNTATDDPKEKTYTQAEVTELIEKRLIREREKQKKAASEAEKLAKMSAQEQAEYQRDEYQKELEELKAKLARADIKETARAMLAADNISIPDDLISAIITDNADTTQQAIKGFAAAFKEAVKNEVANRLKGNEPKASTQSNITKAEILAVKDPIERQKLIREHISLFR
nr:MAG TPA: capsid scaffolding protein [Caudoviricetes sp.]